MTAKASDISTTVRSTTHGLVGGRRSAASLGTTRSTPPNLNNLNGPTPSTSHRPTEGRGGSKPQRVDVF